MTMTQKCSHGYKEAICYDVRSKKTENLCFINQYFCANTYRIEFLQLVIFSAPSSHLQIIKKLQMSFWPICPKPLFFIFLLIPLFFRQNDL